MKKFISAICVIALMMPSTLSVFADAGTADNLSGQQAIVVDVADSTDDAAETETETVVETESASVVSTEKASDTKATSDTSKASETETMDETEDEPEVDPQYADDPQYWKEMKKQYSTAIMSAVPDEYIHNSRFNNGYTIHYGVDVSSWQEDIDWAKAKADGVEFAIIRAGYRGWGSAGNPGKDPYLIKNIEGAQAQGIRVGVYIYSQAITPDEARQEVDWVIGWLQGHQIDLPMVLDYEYAESYGALTGRLYNANLSRQAATDVCLAFCEYASQKGYTPMVYANKGMLENNLDADAISSKYSIWLAHYTQQTGYAGDYDYWQYASTILVDGIPGVVDGNFWYEPISVGNSEKAFLSGYSEPQSINAGESFAVRGTVNSGLPLKSVTVGVYDRNNNQITGGVAYPGTKSYDLSALDASVKISGLTGGIYHYKVMAKTAKAESVLLDKIFSVKSNSATIRDGIYLITSAQNQNKGLSVDNNRNTSGTNILLWDRANIPHRQFQFSYQGNGYYTIRNVGSGLYLSVTGQSAESGANVEQSSSATLWQVLSDGTGGYYILPNCSSTSCLDLYTGKPENGKNIEIWKYNMLGSQRWYLAGTAAKPFISGQSIPENMKQGSSFDIRGIISSGENITSVTVGVYDTSGKQMIGQTVAPNSTSYNLQNIDTSIKFSALTPGAYRYKVVAVSASGTSTLINQIFMVTSSNRTISDGIYLIASGQNQGYTLSVDHNRNTSGTNILLWAKANIPHRQFQFIYQGDGYYTIKNIGSGQYLSVTGQSAKSGANVEQASSAALWQVLPDGTGGYYIVPKCSTTSCLDLYSGIAQNGKNIEIWKYNLLGSQRWYLIGQNSQLNQTARASISGQTIPGNMQQGSSFSIRGTVSSSEKITSVTVGAYDTNGRMKIGKTAQTNANAYNLKNLDTSIKFGSLPTGAYRYKVTVTTASGTYTLLNRIFMVMSNGRTVSNGTYRLVLAQNKNYAISVDHNRKTSGTNLLLWSNSNIAFRRFQFTYQNNGYYTIKNEGSGLYLSVKGQGSASGSNVELSSSATQWQVLPDGTGSYYLVPKCSSTSCLDLYSGVPANGKNIEIWNYNMGKAQRWSLVK